jgi:hypothetical protein
MQLLNVVGDVQSLWLHFLSIIVEDRFSAHNWNIRVPTEECDRVTDYCDEHSIEWKLI